MAGKPLANENELKGMEIIMSEFNGGAGASCTMTNCRLECLNFCHCAVKFAYATI